MKSVIFVVLKNRHFLKIVSFSAHHKTLTFCWYLKFYFSPLLLYILLVAFYLKDKGDLNFTYTFSRWIAEGPTFWWDGGNMSPSIFLIYKTMQNYIWYSFLHLLYSNAVNVMKLSFPLASVICSNRRCNFINTIQSPWTRKHVPALKVK